MKNFELQENVNLAPLTTLKIGGRARFFVSAATETEVIEAVDFARENDLALFILGGGSNILIADEGFEGLVVQIALKGISISAGKDETVLVTARAGEDWDEFVKFCIEKNLAGVECLSGIPGFVGGTPVQNVGAYGQEVAETIFSVRVFDRKSNEILELNNTDCHFTYRTSIFNTTEKNRFVVLAVTYKLEKEGAPKIVYKDLRECFGDLKATLKETREAVLQIRRAKSMVIDADDANTKSAGSFFKNPIVTKEKFAAMCQKYGGEIPHYPVDDERVKIPAAWLIEQSGFPKNFRFGNVGISSKHTLAIINLGNANATDILRFKNEIESKVKEKFAVELTQEPVFVGFPALLEK